MTGSIATTTKIISGKDKINIHDFVNLKRVSSQRISARTNDRIGRKIISVCPEFELEGNRRDSGIFGSSNGCAVGGLQLKIFVTFLEVGVNWLDTELVDHDTVINLKFDGFILKNVIYFNQTSSAYISVGEFVLLKA